MLVLQRRKGETIVVGQDVIIQIVEVKGGGVRIGIEAPVSLQVLRGELLKAEGNLEKDPKINSDPPASQ